jgi:hypothetical protein
MFSLRAHEPGAAVRAYGYLLHVEERVEERVDEARRELEEAREVSLHRAVDRVVVVRRDLKVLLELCTGGCMSTRTGRPADGGRGTLNRFFSSPSDFSFLSRSFMSELLCRS